MGQWRFLFTGLGVGTGLAAVAFLIAWAVASLEAAAIVAIAVLFMTSFGLAVILAQRDQARS